MIVYVIERFMREDTQPKLVDLDKADVNNYSQNLYLVAVQKALKCPTRTADINPDWTRLNVCDIDKLIVELPAMVEYEVDLYFD